MLVLSRTLRASGTKVLWKMKWCGKVAVGGSVRCVVAFLYRFGYKKTPVLRLRRLNSECSGSTFCGLSFGPPLSSVSALPLIPGHCSALPFPQSGSAATVSPWLQNAGGLPFF